MGVDIGSSAIKGIAGRLSGKNFLVDKLSLVPLPPHAVDERGINEKEVVLSALRNVLEEIGAKSEIATAIHGSSVFTKKIVLPKIPKKEIPTQVQWEAEQVFSQDINSILVDHIILGSDKQVPGAPRGTKGWELLLVGVRQEDAKVLEDVFVQAGAQLNCMDVDAFVSGDLFEKLFIDSKKKAIAIVDVGASATRVSVRYKKNTVFLREFAIGGNAFTQIISQSLGVDFDNAESLKIEDGSGIPEQAKQAMSPLYVSWRNELQQCEDIFVSQEDNLSIHKWYLYGGGIKTPGLIDSLQSERIAKKIEIAAFEKAFKAKGKLVDKDLLNMWAARLISVAGLAVREGK